MLVLCGNSMLFCFFVFVVGFCDFFSLFFIVSYLPSLYIRSLNKITSSSLLFIASLSHPSPPLCSISHLFFSLILTCSLTCMYVLLCIDTFNDNLHKYLPTFPHFPSPLLPHSSTHKKLPHPYSDDVLAFAAVSVTACVTAAAPALTPAFTLAPEFALLEPSMYMRMPPTKNTPNMNPIARFSLPLSVMRV